MNWIAFAAAVDLTLAAALLPIVLFPKPALGWVLSLRQPGWALPGRASFALSAAGYLLMGTVLYRALDRLDMYAIFVFLFLLVFGCAWDTFVHCLRSTLGIFVGTLIYVVALVALLANVSEDRVSVLLLAIQLVRTAYAIAWGFAVWRMNPS